MQHRKSSTGLSVSRQSIVLFVLLSNCLPPAVILLRVIYAIWYYVSHRTLQDWPLVIYEVSTKHSVNNMDMKYTGLNVHTTSLNLVQLKYKNTFCIGNVAGVCMNFSFFT